MFDFLYDSKFIIFMCYYSDTKDKIPDVSTPIHTEEMDHIFNQFNGKQFQYIKQDTIITKSTNIMKLKDKAFMRGHLI